MPRNTGKNKIKSIVNTYMSLLFLTYITERIIVNVDRPEANREVQIFPLQHIQGVNQGTYYYGYYIMMQIDMRFIIDDDATDHWKARVYSRNEILLTMPAIDYTITYNRDQFVKAVGVNITDAMDDARHAFEDNKASRMYKHLLLEFPNGHSFSSKEIYDKAGEDEELELSLIPVMAQHKALPDTTQLFAAWTVARVDLKANKRGKVDRKEHKSKAAALLQSFATSSASASAPAPKKTS
jgi:hypothetical protein